MPYPVQHLIEGRGEPVTARLSDRATEALSIMIEHDFSQLPVVDEGQHVLGMVTHQSIARAAATFGVVLDAVSVADSLAKAPSYRPEDDLFDVLDRLKYTNAVLIVDANDRLLGIVTSYDATEFFRQRAEDLMWVEDIEGAVKELVEVPFTDGTGEVDRVSLKRVIQEVSSSTRESLGRYSSAVKKYLQLIGHADRSVDRKCLEQSFSILAPEPKPRDFEDLTLWEYTELLLHKDRWPNYAPFLDKEPDAVRRMMDAVRETRNALVHFRGYISAMQRDQLRFCAEWLGHHPAEELRRHLAGIPAAWPTVASELAVVREKEETEYDPRSSLEAKVVPSGEVVAPSDSRYAALAIDLQSRPPREDRVEFTFEQIEGVINGPLPPSARQHRAWWANDSVGHVQSQQWLDVGWRVAQVNMNTEKVTFARIQGREAAYISFFGKLLGKMRSAPGFPLRDLSPPGQCWHTATSLPTTGAKQLHFVFSFARGRRFRVELYIDTGDKAKNKLIFDRLCAEADKIHSALGEAIAWERLSDNRASRVAWYRPGAITDDEKSLAELRVWAAQAMAKFYDALAQPAVAALLAAEHIE